jgi:N-acetylglucosamine-6-phosphate deacetylase
MNQSSYTLLGKIVLPDKIINHGIVQVINGKIAVVEPVINVKEDYIDMKDKWICPGFIDIHIHAVDGADFMDGSLSSFKAIQSVLPKYGVTSFLATSRTDSDVNIKNFLTLSQQASRQNETNEAQILGVHLEGPWISPKFSGAQNPGLMENPDIEKMVILIETYKDMIKIVTLAPEIPGGIEAVRCLSEKGIIVSAGHSAANLEEMEEAILSGVTHVTHCFNGMSPFHHRNPGLAFAALHREELTCELIADGLHVHPEVIKFMYKVKSAAKMILISDCTGANKMENGTYRLGGKKILKQGKKISLQDGTLAGSAITLIDAVQYLNNKIKFPLHEVIQMASTNPAQAIVPHLKKGMIHEGYDADLVILDENFDVYETIIGGKTVYKTVRGRKVDNSHP